VILWLVAWTALSCPGGVLKGLIPLNLRPLVCDSMPTAQLYATQPEALLRLKEQGPQATLQICGETKGLMRCQPIKVTWSPDTEMTNDSRH
jgi:hypothetical protein